MNLQEAVEKYHKALLETNKCTTLMSYSISRPDEAAQIMQDMYKAQAAMFLAAGIDYDASYKEEWVPPTRDGDIP